MSVTIRELEQSDRARWDELWQGYLTFYKEELEDEITERTWSRLINTGNIYGFVAVDDDGKIVGFTHYHFQLTTWSAESTIYLEDLFVDPDVRRSGAGEALIRAVYCVAKENGSDGVYWMTQEHNKTARSLYNRVATLSDFLRYEWHGD